MTPINEATLSFPSHRENSTFARDVTGAFAERLNLTLAELHNIESAVEEAVLNCIDHAYPDCVGNIELRLRILDDDQSKVFEATISDRGIGIADVDKAQGIFFSTDSKNHSGTGFLIMQNYCDKVTVHSTPNEGTEVKLEKRIKSATPLKVDNNE